MAWNEDMCGGIVEGRRVEGEIDGWLSRVRWRICIRRGRGAGKREMAKVRPCKERNGEEIRL